jgi:hypothetical protein
VQTRVRGAGGSGLPSGSRSSAPFASTGRPELVDGAAEVVHRLAVGGPERKALRVDPRQPDGMGHEPVV